MSELFNESELLHKHSDKTCGQCAYVKRPHWYRKDWLYCSIRWCSKTQFGLQKVKSRQTACHKFREGRNK